MFSQPRELVLLDQAHQALCQARSIDEVKDLRDKAEAVKAYARKARLGKQILVEASAIKVRAERRLGEILRQTPLANSAPGNQYTGRVEVFSGNDAPLRLADVGLTKSDSSRLQKIASLPRQEFERYLAERVDAFQEPTTAGLLQLVKQHRMAQRVRSHATPAGGIVRSLQPLIDRGEKFTTVYADPPWDYENQASPAANGNQASPLTIDEICGEPVARLTTQNAHLHLWTTNAFLPDAFDVIEAWGFAYKSCFVWVKPQIGLGNYWRVSHEFLLLGVKGKLTFQERNQRSWAELHRTQHSRKPDEIRQIIEQVSPAPYLEMYGRCRPPNSQWTVYGNQVV
jgi:N6-adenosine-specific RNA methylase IME4